MPTQTAAQQHQQAATAVKVAGAAAAAKTADATVAGAADVATATASAAAATLVAALVAFLAGLRGLHRAWLRKTLTGRGATPEDVDSIIAQEMSYEMAFAQASADRLAAALPAVLSIADPVQRRDAAQQALDNEERYAQQRARAMAARVFAALGRITLRRSSPRGAWWELGVAKTHTDGCRFMAGKFWPWAVLDRVHPPRHNGCVSTLHGEEEAIRNGWMTEADIPDVRRAVRMASGVVMEAEEAERLIAELELRDRLLEAGFDTALIPFEGIA